MTEKGIKGLTVTFDSFDEVLLVELKSYILGLLKDPWDLAHDYKETLKAVDGFMVVVSSYSRPSEYNEFRESIKEDYDTLVKLAFPPVTDPFDIKVLNIRDMLDGSANVELEVSDKMKELLIGIGLNKLLEDHAEQTVEEAIDKHKVSIEIESVPGWEYFNDLF